jgi:hypothetical protein
MHLRHPSMVIVIAWWHLNMPPTLRYTYNLSSPCSPCIYNHTHHHVFLSGFPSNNLSDAVLDASLALICLMKNILDRLSSSIR